MAPSAFHPGEHFDDLLDMLSDMGRPSALPPKAKPIQWGRVAGEQTVWLRVLLPGDYPGTVRVAERDGPTLDLAAKAMIDIELTAGDKETEDAAGALGAEA